VILDHVEELRALRYQLCPSQMRDDLFWQGTSQTIALALVYFMLVKNKLSESSRLELFAPDSPRDIFGGSQQKSFLQILGISGNSQNNDPMTVLDEYFERILTPRMKNTDYLQNFSPLFQNQQPSPSGPSSVPMSPKQPLSQPPKATSQPQTPQSTKPSVIPKHAALFPEGIRPDVDDYFSEAPPEALATPLKSSSKNQPLRFLDPSQLQVFPETIPAEDSPYKPPSIPTLTPESPSVAVGETPTTNLNIIDPTSTQLVFL
jgi:hypothetical protein